MKIIHCIIDIFIYILITVLLNGNSSLFGADRERQHQLFGNLLFFNNLKINSSSTEIHIGNPPEFSGIADNEKVVVINEFFFAAAKNMQLGDTVLVDLFNGEQAVLEIQSAEIDVNNVTSLRGPVQGNHWDFFYISIDGDKLYLTLDSSSSGRKFAVLFNKQTGWHHLYEIPIEKISTPEESPPINHDGANVDNSVKYLFNSDGYADHMDQATVDIMIVYTPAAKSWADANAGGINNVINQAMSRAKQALDNSNTLLTLNLVHSAELTYTESTTYNSNGILTTDSGKDLDRLQKSSDGHMDIVHAWRNAHGADIVALLAKLDDTGGSGYALMSSALPAGLPDWAFSIIRVQQAASSYTFVHEIGHNMGAGHHKEQNKQPGPQFYPYSAGWRWQSGGVWYSSIMSYESGEYYYNGITSTRVPYFSNPDVMHFSASTGHATEADNARTLRETKHIVSNYRSAPPEISISTGWGHHLVVKKDGTLFAWGSNYFGQLGDGTTKNTKTLPSQSSADSDWEKVAGGGSSSFECSHSLALKKDGTLWGWGCNIADQIGGDTIVPAQIGSQVKNIAAGGCSTLVLKKDGTLWGGGSLNAFLWYFLTKIGTESDWASIAAGGAHGAAIKQNGTLWTFGTNSAGQLGDGTTVDTIVPVRVGAESDWASVSAGDHHTVAIKTNGTLWGWGSNFSGQLGIGSIGGIKTTPIQTGSSSDWQTVAAGSNVTFGLKKDGTLWRWGGGVTNAVLPVQVGTDKDWKFVAASHWARTLALKNDDTIWEVNVVGSPVLVIDEDGIDDTWERQYFDDLSTASASSDFDKDGYSDRQEYLNWVAGINDPVGVPFDPVVKNASGGAGYQNPMAWLPAVKLLLKK